VRIAFPEVPFRASVGLQHLVSHSEVVHNCCKVVASDLIDNVLNEEGGGTHSRADLVSVKPTVIFRFNPCTDVVSSPSCALRDPRHFMVASTRSHKKDVREGVDIECVLHQLSFGGVHINPGHVDLLMEISLHSPKSVIEHFVLFFVFETISGKSNQPWRTGISVDYHLRLFLFFARTVDHRPIDVLHVELSVCLVTEPIRQVHILPAPLTSFRSAVLRANGHILCCSWPEVGNYSIKSFNTLNSSYFVQVISKSLTHRMVSRCRFIFLIIYNRQVILSLSRQR